MPLRRFAPDAAREVHVPDDTAAPGACADETAAWDDDGAGGAETTIVPPAATEAAPELAWSLADSGDDDEARPHESWRAALVAAAAIAVLCGIGAALIMTLSRHESTDTELQGGTLAPVATKPAAALPPISTEPSPADIHAGVSPPLAAPPPSTVTVTPPPPAPSTVTVQAAPPPPAAESVDDQFIAALNRAQITVDNRSNVITAAHRVCMLFGRGYSRADIVAAVKANADSATDLGAADYVAEATAFYCPQYVGR